MYIRSISETGLNLIQHYEGLHLEPYKDPIGKWTIGYGHLIKGNESYLKEVKLSYIDALNLMRYDLFPIELYLSFNFRELDQNQFDALCSFCFNLGMGNFHRSDLKEYLLGKDYWKASQEFANWRKAGGKVLNGLVKRRHAEAALFSGNLNLMKAIMDENYDPLHHLVDVEKWHRHDDLLGALA